MEAPFGDLLALRRKLARLPAAITWARAPKYYAPRVRQLQTAYL
jgi:hypothetical protein